MKLWTTTIYISLFCFASHFLLSQRSNTYSNIQNSAIDYLSSNHGAVQNNAYIHGNIYQDNEALFSSGFINFINIAGRSEVGNIHLAGANYTKTSSDFTHGVLDEKGTPLQGSSHFFDRFWKIRIDDLVNIKEKFENNTLSLSDIPLDILEWPARLNPHITSVDMDRHLAPFSDYNGDGVYDPLDGDTPIILEEDPSFVPFEFHYCVYHDKKIHGFSQGLAMGVMVEQLQYVAECVSEDIARSVVTRLKVTNKSNIDFNNSFFGLRTNKHVGCDYLTKFGYNDKTGSTYVYKGENQEFECARGDIPVPEGLEVIEVLVPLNYDFSSVVKFRLPSYPYEETCTSVTVWSQLNGNWAGGSPVTYGGTGLNPGSTDTVKFMYPDFPNDDDGWWMEEHDGKNDVISSISLADWAAGETKVFDFAELVLVFEVMEPHEIFSEYEDRIESYKADIEAIVNGDQNCDLSIVLCQDDCMWPGDADTDGQVDNEDIAYWAYHKNIDLDKQERNEKDILWYSHEATNWGIGLDGIDLKHSDVNGDGVLNQGDVRDIKRNFKRANSNYNGEYVVADYFDELGFSIEHLRDEYNMQGHEALTKVGTRLSIGRIQDLFEVPLFSLSFDIEYPSEILNPEDELLNYKGTLFDHLAVIDEYGKDLYYDFGVHIAPTTKMNYTLYSDAGNSQLRGGLISSLRYKIRNNVSTTNADGRDTFYFEISDVHAITEDGELIDYGMKYNQPLIVYNMNVEDPVSNNVVTNIALNIMPNPAENIIQVTADKGDRLELLILDLAGRVMGSYDAHAGTVSIDISEFPSGIYFVRSNKSGNRGYGKFVKL